MDGKPQITRRRGRWYVRDPWYGVLTGPYVDYQEAREKARSLAIVAARVTRGEEQCPTCDGSGMIPSGAEYAGIQEMVGCPDC